MGAGSVWVANSLSGTVTRVDPRTGEVRGTVDVGSGADALAVTRGAVWVANGLAGTVSRIDVRDGRVTKTIDFGGRPSTLAAGDTKVYVGLRTSGASHVGGTLRVLLSDLAPRHVDTATAYSPETWRILALTNDGLVGWRRVGGQAGTELVPDLAVSLPSVSGDRLRYTFQLRRGVTYSNGRSVRPGDVRYSFERLFKLKPRRQPTVAESYRAIVGADRCSARPSRCDLSRGIVTDDRAGTVTFRLATPDPDFLFKLAVPFAYVLPAGTTLREAVQKPLPATGPYRVASVSGGGSLRLVRNARFREWSSAAQPAGFPDEIVLRPIRNDGAAGAARCPGQGGLRVDRPRGASRPTARRPATAARSAARGNLLPRRRHEAGAVPGRPRAPGRQPRDRPEQGRPARRRPGARRRRRARFSRRTFRGTSPTARIRSTRAMHRVGLLPTWRRRRG